MNSKFLTPALFTLISFGATAGVKVTSLDLAINENNGSINISLDGRSGELPDVKVFGKTIMITLADAEAFNAISKNIRGAQLSANVLNGKAIVKAILPYDVNPNGVDLGWNNKNIEVVFPRGKVARVELDRLSTPPAPEKLADIKNKERSNNVLAKVENQVIKEKLNEEYLNNLMKEEKNKADQAKVQPNKDEVNVRQSSLSRPVAPPVAIATKADNFSFAGYALKFTIFLAMVLGLFYGIVQLLKKGLFNRGKLGFLNSTQLIQVLSTTYIAPKRSLMVIKAHKQIFLVSNCESGIQFLSEMSDTTGLIKEGEKQVTGTNFDINLGSAELSTSDSTFKIKDNINESTPFPETKGIASLTAKDIVKFSDELKKKAKKLKPIEFNS
jgi:flagellar biogenesis protein FliO